MTEVGAGSRRPRARQLPSRPADPDPMFHLRDSRTTTTRAMNDRTPSRRDFLQIIFKTMPALALAGPTLADLWPEEACQRECHPPLELERDEQNYLHDPDFDYDEMDWPTIGDHLDERYGFLSLDRTRQDEVIWEFLGLDPEDEEATPEELELFRSQLDDQVEWEHLDPRRFAEMGEHGPGIEIYDALIGAGYEDLDLGLIEGDHPGSTFVGVVYLGDLDLLNRRLAKHGLNMVVREARR